MIFDRLHLWLARALRCFYSRKFQHVPIHHRTMRHDRRALFRLCIQLYSPPIIAILRTGVDFFFFPFAEGGNLASGTVIGSVILIREEEERE